MLMLTLFLVMAVGWAAVQVNAQTRYTVRQGDSLFLISRQFGTTVDALRAANGLWGDIIYPGQVLIIPSSSAPSGHIGPYSQADLTLLARLVTAEAGAEPYNGQVAVAASVLNRVRSNNYPNTIPGVIYQVVDGRFYQYCPVQNGTINNTPTLSARRAVNDAVAGIDPSRGAIGFYNPRNTSNRWVLSRPITAVIGNHVFYR